MGRYRRVCNRHKRPDEEGTVFAAVDPTGVRRYPAQCAQDATTVTVVTPPRGMMLPNNALLYSRHGDMNSKLAGGDVDGDLCQVSFWHDLVELIRHTEADVDVEAQDLQRVEEEALSRDLQLFEMDAPKKFSTREFWRAMRAAALELGVQQDIG
ncbi:unnamed protein product [Symbiodinium sp. KB8]|nr:unnamed protein product [Symbiodinium sp. KB8]